MFLSIIFWERRLPRCEQRYKLPAIRSGSQQAVGQHCTTRNAQIAAQHIDHDVCIFCSMTRAAQARRKVSTWQRQVICHSWLVGPAALAAEIKMHNTHSACDTAWVAGPVALDR